MPTKPFLEAGQIVGTHGVRGEVRVQPWCDSPAFLAQFRTLYFDEGRTPVKVKARPHQNVVLMTLEGVSTVQEASALRGRVLYLNRADVELPEGSYFIQDLIGLRVVDADSGREYGTLVEVSATGANDVYHIRTPQGDALIPAVPSVVIDTDIAGGVMAIRPIKGMFDDAF